MTIRICFKWTRISLFIQHGFVYLNFYFLFEDNWTIISNKKSWLCLFLFGFCYVLIRFAMLSNFVYDNWIWCNKVVSSQMFRKLCNKKQTWICIEYKENSFSIFFFRSLKSFSQVSVYFHFHLNILFLFNWNPLKRWIWLLWAFAIYKDIIKWTSEAFSGGKKAHDVSSRLSLTYKICRYRKVSFWTHSIDPKLIFHLFIFRLFPEHFPSFDSSASLFLSLMGEW